MDGESYYKALRDHFLMNSALCCYLFKDDMTEEDRLDMACYIAMCSNNKLGINHNNRVVQDVLEKIKTKFEKLSSKFEQSYFSSLGDLSWFHLSICLIKYFIRAERLHDFDLHLAIVAKMLLIFAAAG